MFQTTLPEFQKSDFLVVRQHEEFVWLHDRFEENEEYAGYIVRELWIYINSDMREADSSTFLKIWILLSFDCVHLALLTVKILCTEMLSSLRK